MPKRECTESVINDVPPFWKRTNGYTLHGGPGVTRWPKTGLFTQEEYYENVDGKAIWAKAAFDSDSASGKYQGCARIYTNKHCFNAGAAAVSVVFSDVHCDVVGGLAKVDGSTIGVQVERWKENQFLGTVYSERAWEPSRLGTGQYEPDPKPHVFDLPVDSASDYWVVFFIDAIIQADGGDFSYATIKATLNSVTWTPTADSEVLSFDDLPLL